MNKNFLLFGIHAQFVEISRQIREIDKRVVAIRGLIAKDESKRKTTPNPSSPQKDRYQADEILINYVELSLKLRDFLVRYQKEIIVKIMENTLLTELSTKILDVVLLYVPIEKQPEFIKAYVDKVNQILMNYREVAK